MALDPLAAAFIAVEENADILKGDFGPAGPQGAKGDPGRDGQNGSNGDMGPVGPEGKGGPRGPKGDKGDKGDEGERGIQGARGETGAAGSGRSLFPRSGGGSGGGAPSGPAGGVLAGTFPDPSFAADMATQAELDAHAAAPQKSALALLIAASDADATTIAAADYVCDGTADDVQIAAAIAASGGRPLRLSDGTFTIAATLTLGTGTILQGAGRAATTIAGVAGMTASMIVLATDSSLSDLAIAAPTSLTSDIVTGTAVSRPNLRNLAITYSGLSSTIYGLTLTDWFSLHANNISITTTANGLQLAEVAGVYNVGNSVLSLIEIYLVTAARTGVRIEGHPGGVNKYVNLCSFNYLGVTDTSGGVASIGLDIINSQHLTFVNPTIEGPATSLHLDGLAGGASTLCRDNVFITAFFAGNVTADSGVRQNTFIGGQIQGTISQVETNYDYTFDYIRTIDSSGALLRRIAPGDAPYLVTTAHAGLSAEVVVPAAVLTVLDDTTVAAMVDTLGGASSTGTGGLVRATSPALVTPALGTPASGVATNLTGTAAGLTAGTVTTNANLTGAVTSVGNATSQTGTINFIIDGAGSAITTGIKGDVVVDFACTVTAWDILADQSGSIVVDIWKDTYANFPPVVGDSMTTSEKPTLSGAAKNQDTSLNSGSGWAITAGDTLRFNVDSITTVTRVTVALKFVR